MMTGHIPTSVVDEVEQGILKETDYLNEARNLEFFGEQLKAVDYERVPRAFPELTTDRVLAMSRIEGVPLDQFLAQKPSPELRNLLGHRLLKLFLFQIRDVRAIHADPHSGNYLFTREGRIGLVEQFDYVFPPPESEKRWVSFDDPKLGEIGLRIRKQVVLARLAQPEFRFYARAELGLYNYLRQLRARLDTAELLQKRHHQPDKLPR